MSSERRIFGDGWETGIIAHILTARFPWHVSADDLYVILVRSGGMGEWLKPAVLKTVSVGRRSGVRIPLPPPGFHPAADIPL